MTELKDQLSLLGRKTEYKQDYAPEVLEAFDNKHPDNDYFVKFNCPEFTSLCPITGQPDFATIYINYVPDERMVETVRRLRIDATKHVLVNSKDRQEDLENIEYIHQELVELLENSIEKVKRVLH